MTEIIDFGKAKAAKEARDKQTKRKPPTSFNPEDLDEVIHPIMDLGRFHYGLGLLAGDDELKQIGADALVQTEGMHKAGQAIENLELKHKLRNKRKPRIKPVKDK